MSSLNLHPYCAVFPQMDEAELDNLTADIKANGFRLDQPIVKMPDGSILDGRNRALAAERAGVSPVMITYDPDPKVHGPDPLAFVVSRNLARRHLTDIERAFIGAEITTLQHGQRKDYAESVIRDSAIVTQSEAASLMKVNVHAIGDATALKKHAEPNIIAMVKTGKTGMQPAVSAARATPRDQQGNLTPADITRIHQDRKTGNTPLKARERLPSAAAARREAAQEARERDWANRPKFKPPSSALTGRPVGAEALEPDPDNPNLNRGQAFTEKNGRVLPFLPDEVERQKLYERCIEFNAALRVLVKETDWPSYADLARLDDRRRNNVLRFWRQHREGLYAVLDAAIGHPAIRSEQSSSACPASEAR